MFKNSVRVVAALFIIISIIVYQYKCIKNLNNNLITNFLITEGQLIDEAKNKKI